RRGPPQEARRRTDRRPAPQGGARQGRTDARRRLHALKLSIPVFPSWDTVGSPVCRPEEVLRTGAAVDDLDLDLDLDLDPTLDVRRQRRRLTLPLTLHVDSG